MAIKVLHLSDIHLGSTTHGKINPQTGLNTRLEDFVAALTLCIDRAIREPADLVLFGGDAFPDATPPPLVQQAFAKQFRRLADAGIPTVLLVGNHDQHSQGVGGASLAIYRSLAVPNFTVGDTIATHCISTNAGAIQIITLPWITRSTLLTKSETEGFSMAEVSQFLIDRLQVVIEGEIRQLDPSLPTILLAHVMVDTATYGAERFLAAGKGFTIPLSMLTRAAFDYVALGHVHRHQILATQPMVVYPGSIERVDFGEENEAKGYCWLEVEKGNVKFEFCPIPTRVFRTIEVDVTQAEDPQAKLLKAIQKGKIDRAIARLIYKIKAEQLALIDDRLLHEAMESAHNYSLIPEVVSQNARSRMPDLSTAEALDPMTALKTYLSTREDLQNLEPEMLNAAQELLSEIGLAMDSSDPAIDTTQASQLVISFD
ncbi:MULTISPECIES: exonuclease subunit SbcD [Pseudanabaena]|uniref:Nuclease SbcCD subunit D n=2 Tax=Pseudanabaena TaxID=1152 RepID=L8N1C0_9CYAN|nr:MULTISPECIES: exonuclease subunit SbcD [Pseudanabaena]ELS32530.1 Exodeoxyribonuclease I subunit D [Pseudanabaena biceps PCC 7429]MDG3495228.1 exonuclease subunit SbcD [Pseudanabaena catenata USMAC16]